MRILTAAQMREADRRTIEDIGIPSLVLMENAGRQVVAAIEAAYEARLDGRVAVLCGRGNNGGDGFVVARTLLQRGIDAAVFVIGAVADVRGDARTNLDILGRLGVTVVEIGDEQSWELHFSEISQCTLIVDAIFGTGLKAALGGMMETVAADMNESLAKLAESFRTLSETVKEQQQRLGRVEKQFGLPNSAAPAERVSKATVEDVGWPLDLNKPKDRESVDKAISFHDL